MTGFFFFFGGIREGLAMWAFSDLRSLDMAEEGTIFRPHLRFAAPITRQNPSQGDRAE